MKTKLSFETTLEICDALGRFADARLQALPDKDLILIATSIDGRKSLATCRLSEMNWRQRVIRFFGFGAATLRSVAKVLEENEPCLPHRFSSLQQSKLPYSFHDQTALRELKRERFKVLRNDKANGCNHLLDCISRHNARSSLFKVYINLAEHEKIDLKSPTCEPIGLLPEEYSKEAIRRKYKAPPLDYEQFQYRDPASFKAAKIVDPNVLGFCHEYGLGVRRDAEGAFNFYEMAVKMAEEPSVAARFNYGRLLLAKKLFQEAISELSELKELIEKRAKRAAEIHEALIGRRAASSKSPLLPIIEARLAESTKMQKQQAKLAEKTALALTKALEGRP